MKEFAILVALESFLCNKKTIYAKAGQAWVEFMEREDSLDSTKIFRIPQRVSSFHKRDRSWVGSEIFKDNNHTTILNLELRSFKRTQTRRIK